MRDSQASKTNGRRNRSGIGDFFRRSFGTSMNRNSSKRSSASGAASLFQAENVVQIAPNCESVVSNVATTAVVSSGSQESTNTSKRRSTFGSRLSVHSLFFPSAYSTTINGGNAVVANANTSNIATAPVSVVETLTNSYANRQSKMSRSTNDLQTSAPVANDDDKEQQSVTPTATIHRSGSTERLLTSMDNGNNISTPDRVVIFLDNKSMSQVPSDGSPILRSGSASDHDQDSVNLSSTVGTSTSSGTGPSTKVKQRECPLCLTRQPSLNFPQLSYCHHRSCQSCLVQYLHMEILESRVNVTCPECNEPMHPNDIYKILSLVDSNPLASVTVLRNQFLIEKYEEFSVRRVLMSDPDTRWCPAPDCGYAVIATGCAACPELRCQRPGCGTLFCYHCKMIWHPNQTCDEARAQRGSFATSPIHIDTTIRPGDIKACPRCRTYIVKMNDGSCNHMICALCGAEFCWLCLREISDLHYLSPSGCTFWGKKPWSRKKKLLWQLGMLVGAPVGIALVAGLAVPAIMFGVPVWVGRKVHQKLKDSSKARRRLAIAGSVFGSVLMSPVLASMAVGVGVPIMLAYVYGVVPLSLCRNGSCGVTANSSGVRLDLDDDILAMTGGVNSETGAIHEKAQLLKDVDKQDASTVTGFSIHSGSTQHKLQIQADVCSTGTGAILGSGLSTAKQRRSSMESGATASLCGERCFINYEEASTKALAGSTYCDDKSVHTMGSLLEGGGGAYYAEPDQTSMKGLSGSVGCGAAETKSSKSVSSAGATQLPGANANVDNASVVAMAGSICGVTVDVSSTHENNGQCSRCGGRKASNSLLRTQSHHHHHHHVHIDDQIPVDDRERERLDRESSVGRHHSVEQRVTRFADDPCVFEVPDASQYDRHYGFLPIDEESNANPNSNTSKSSVDEQPSTSAQGSTPNSNIREKSTSLRRFLFLRGNATSDEEKQQKRSYVSVSGDGGPSAGAVDLKSISINVGGTTNFDSEPSPSYTVPNDGKRCRIHREECQCDDAEFLLLPPDAYIVQHGRFGGPRRLSTLSARSDSMKKSRSWSALLLDGGNGNLATTSSVAAEIWSTVRGAFGGSPSNSGEQNVESAYHQRYISRSAKRPSVGGGLVQRLRPGRRATVSNSVASVSSSRKQPVDKRVSKRDVAFSCASLPDSYSAVPVPGRCGGDGDGDVCIILPSRQRTPSDSAPFLKPTASLSSSGGNKRFSSTLVNIFKPSGVHSMDELRLSNFDILDNVKDRRPCERCRGVSRRYFCYTCYSPMPDLIDRLPRLRLPIKIDIVRHPKEKHGKSTGVQCAVLAPDSVRLFLYPDFPDYTNEKVILVFPDSSALSFNQLSTLDSRSTEMTAQQTCAIDLERRSLIRRYLKAEARFVFIDCTWLQVSGMRKHDHFRTLPTLTLHGRRTRYWRPQRNRCDGYLSTVEAVYYLCLDYERWIHEENAREQTYSYDGRYDDLLYFFEYFARKVDREMKAREERKKRKLNA